MSEIDSERFPKAALIGAGALVGITLLLTGATSLGLIQKTPSPQQARVDAHVKPISSRSLSFMDAPGGTLEIRDTDKNEIAYTIKKGEKSGFIRGVLRGLARERKMNDVGEAPPFRLTSWADGALTLQDISTGRIIELGSFGPDNRASFAALLDTPKVAVAAR